MKKVQVEIVELLRDMHVNNGARFDNILSLLEHLNESQRLMLEVLRDVTVEVRRLQTRVDALETDID